MQIKTTIPSVGESPSIFEVTSCICWYMFQSCELWIRSMHFLFQEGQFFLLFFWGVPLSACEHSREVILIIIVSLAVFLWHCKRGKMKPIHFPEEKLFHLAGHSISHLMLPDSKNTTFIICTHLAGMPVTQYAGSSWSVRVPNEVEHPPWSLVIKQVPLVFTFRQVRKKRGGGGELIFCVRQPLDRKLLL